MHSSSCQHGSVEASSLDAVKRLSAMILQVIVLASTYISCTSYTLYIYFLPCHQHQWNSMCRPLHSPIPSSICKYI